MDRYPENASAEDRLRWYSENDIGKGLVLCELLDYLEECYCWDITFDE
jgi:hypothetical protein